MSIQKISSDLNISKNIQSLRKKRHMTQEQVVAKLQLLGLPISKSTYAKIETNRMNIKVSELIALASIFQTDLNAFFKDISIENIIVTSQENEQK